MKQFNTNVRDKRRARLSFAIANKKSNIIDNITPLGVLRVSCNIKIPCYKIKGQVVTA